MNELLVTGQDGRASAVLSKDGMFRYALTRRWGPGATLLFVMLNPSRADATKDDPTIRRCIGFAKRERFEAIEVVNLFAYRETNPLALTEVWQIGPDNDRTIREAMARADQVVAAWGATPTAIRRTRAAVVRIILDGKASCFGLTGDRQPKHPLYIKGDAPFSVFAEDHGVSSLDLFGSISSVCRAPVLAPRGIVPAAELHPEGDRAACGSLLQPTDYFEVPQEDGSTVRRPGAWSVCGRLHQTRCGS